MPQRILDIIAEKHRNAVAIEQARRDQQEIDRYHQRRASGDFRTTIFDVPVRVRLDAERAARRAHPTVQPCEVCSSMRAVRHHDDYGKPLEIRWLCRTHHRQWHTSNALRNWTN